MKYTETNFGKDNVIVKNNNNLMKKVFIIYPSGSRYLVGFCTDLTKFAQNYISERSGVSDVAQMDENTLFYTSSDNERMTMYSVLINNNETCFMKSI